MTVHLKPSKTCEWGTPPRLVQYLADKYAGGAFDLDAAACDAMHVADTYYSKELCGLENPWFGRVWCNPPYGWEWEWAFVEKAVNEMKAGRVDTVVMLLPSKTGSKWWHAFVEPNRDWIDVEFLKGRVCFEGPNATTAPFYSVVLIMKRGCDGDSLEDLTKPLEKKREDT